MRPLLGLTLAATLLLTGCSGAPLARDEPSSSPSNTPDDTASAKPSKSASPTGVPPNVGDTALQLGQPRKGLSLTTTVLEVRQGATGPEFAQPDPGQEWTIVRAKQCSKADSPESFPTTFFDYIGLDDDGGQYDASGTAYSGWPPTPRYPAERQLAPGQCVTGWILFQVAEGQRFTKIALNAGDGSFSAEWVLPD